MAYIRIPNTVIAGVGLNQAPDATGLQPAGALNIVLNANISTTEQLGVVKIGDNISIGEDGTISVNPIVGPQGEPGPAGPQGEPGSIDYQTGNWIPKLINDIGGAAISINVLNAKYTKIENSVSCTFDFTVSDMSNASASSKVMLEGLPFLSDGSGQYAGTLIISYFRNMDTPVTCISGAVLSNSFACDLWRVKANVSNIQVLERDDIKIGTNLVGCILYICE